MAGEGHDIVRVLKHLLLAVTYGLLGSFIVVVSAYVYLQENRPDLKVWWLPSIFPLLHRRWTCCPVWIRMRAG